MKARLVLASTVTLTVLVGFVASIVLAALYFSGSLNAWLMIGLTIAINFIMWLLAPTLQDLMLSWVYKSKVISLDDLAGKNEGVAQFLREVCERHKVKIPSLRIINDLNPTAFCYGSVPNNSRLVVSEGIFNYLDTEESKTVFAHEMGHIVNRDFIVMTVASTLLQILYELYVILARSRSRSSSNDKSFLPLIGLVAYVFYFIGSYLLLYLSRTREYLADRFAAEETKNPNALSSALVKIAYGIAEQPDTEQTKRLLASTRALGIYDFKAADSLGGVQKASATAVAEKEATRIIGVEKVFLFDLYNPWAAVAEINSTHPLTGKRIKVLNESAREFGLAPAYNFEAVDLYGKAIDKQRLYSNFAFEVLIYFAPFIGLLLGFIPMFFNEKLVFLFIAGLGIGFIIKGLYRFPSGSSFEKTTVYDLMCNPYASPLRGIAVEVEGRVIGRADSGSQVSEDFTIQDRSGCLIMLNYESIWGPIGNLIVGMTKTGKLVDKEGIARGWFRRSISQLIDLQSFTYEGNVMVSYTLFWAIGGGAIVTLIGAALTVLMMMK
ncbi:MAG: M48 family metalloprotease [Candidatus Eremiobacteraeota bacterium]|nr:M48 family metalloprotease [Candidatus Eremiobacteraeota bacterium]